jgi:hypothetical protein
LAGTSCNVRELFKFALPRYGRQLIIPDRDRQRPPFETLFPHSAANTFRQHKQNHFYILIICQIPNRRCTVPNGLNGLAPIKLCHGRPVKPVREIMQLCDICIITFSNQIAAEIVHGNQISGM